MTDDDRMATLEKLGELPPSLRRETHEQEPTEDMQGEAESNPLTAMPTFEEYRQQMDADSEPSELIDDATEAIAEVVEDNDVKSDIAEKAFDNVPLSQQPEEEKPLASPERTVEREQVAAGDKSAVYVFESADGSKHTKIESDYFNIASKFNRTHDEIKTDLGFKQAVSGLSLDLAVIDAFGEQAYETGDESYRQALLKNYSSLRARLDDPNTSQKEKGIIADYFDRLGGKALDFLESHYEPDQAEPEDAEVKAQKEENRENLKDKFEEIRASLEKTREILLENCGEVDEALAKIGELTSDDSVDIDTLQAELDEFSEQNEALLSFSKELSSQNPDEEEIENL